MLLLLTAWENALNDLPALRKGYLIGLFLCSQNPVFVLQELRPAWNELIQLSPFEKLNKINAVHELGNIFPWNQQLSETIETDAFATSFLIQPDVFLRLRPGKKQEVFQQMVKAQIPHRLIDEACIAVGSGTKLEEIIAIDKDAVIQDYSSQQVLAGLVKNLASNQKITAWDCCAASGGKSILLKDTYPATHS